MTLFCVIYVHQVALSELLFVADNLAYFSYQQLDEPLYVMNQIDMIVTTSGSLVLDMFTEVTVTALLQLSQSYRTISTKDDTHKNTTIAVFR